MSWIVSLPEDISVSAECDEELVLTSPAARLVLKQLSPASRDALGRLAYPGEAVGRLVASLPRTHVSTEPACLFYYLRCLARRGFLLITATAGNQRLATVMPTADTFVLARGAVSDHPLVLSRFAYIRRMHDELVLESPLSAARVLLHDNRVALLAHTLATPTTMTELSKRVPGLPAETVASLITLLLNSGMLSPVNEHGTSDEDDHPSIPLWEFHDLLFHARSRDGRHGSPGKAPYPLARRPEPPPALKPAAATELITLYRPLPNRLEQEDPPLARVMEQRRSIREYGEEPITAEQLGEFLFRVARVKEYAEVEIITVDGPTRLDITSRPYPAAGALYELEIYPVVRACHDLDSGLYHYDPFHHRLRRVTRWTAEVEQLLENASWAAGIPACNLQVLLVITARFHRITWKYEDFSYSLILKNVGVIYHGMYLAATAMGLAPCAIGVGNSDLFARAIGSDYYAETSVGEFLLGSKP